MVQRHWNADIPNPSEGWGEIDLEQTIMPMHNGNNLTTFINDGPELNPGYSILYSFDIDPSSGLDATLVWSDKAGSSSSSQSESKLVNDLDLILLPQTALNTWVMCFQMDFPKREAQLMM